MAGPRFRLPQRGLVGGRRKKVDRSETKESEFDIEAFERKMVAAVDELEKGTQKYGALLEFEGRLEDSCNKLLCRVDVYLDEEEMDRKWVKQVDTWVKASDQMRREIQKEIDSLETIMENNNNIMETGEGIVMSTDVIAPERLMSAIATHLAVVGEAIDKLPEPKPDTEEKDFDEEDVDIEDEDVDVEERDLKQKLDSSSSEKKNT